MTRRILLAAALLCCNLLYAIETKVPAPAFTQTYTYTPTPMFTFGLAVTQGWKDARYVNSIAATHHHPNVISELTIKDINMYQTHLIGSAQHNGTFLIFDEGYGYIYHGMFRDSDYAKSHKRYEFSRSAHHLSNSYAFDTKITAGQKFNCCNNSVRIAPTIGYEWDYAKFKINSGRQLLTPRKTGIVRTNDSIHGLHSHIKAKFDSPFVGCNLLYDTKVSLAAYLNYEFHFLLRTKNRAYWNLRQLHFTEVSKRDKGFGHTALAGILYTCTPKLHLRTEYEYAWKKGRDGSVHFKSHHTHASQPFNHGLLHSSEIRLCLEYLF